MTFTLHFCYSILSMFLLKYFSILAQLIKGIKYYLRN
jgi:hypothetical protein